MEREKIASPAGKTTDPSVSSTSSTGTFRQPSSMAVQRPTGPPPTTITRPGSGLRCALSAAGRVTPAPHTSSSIELGTAASGSGGSAAAMR